MTHEIPEWHGLTGTSTNTLTRFWPPARPLSWQVPRAAILSGKMAPQPREVEGRRLMPRFVVPSFPRNVRPRQEMLSAPSLPPDVALVALLAEARRQAERG